MSAKPWMKSAADLHRAWLELVEIDGPFLAVPPLKRVWPQGMPRLADDRLDTLREAKPAFDHAWEALDRNPDDEPAQAKYHDVRDDWVRTVLRDVAGWAESLEWGTSTATATSPDRRVSVHADAVLRGPDGIGALVSVVDRCESLHQTGTDGWAASAVDRLEAMLRGSGVEIGIVTDGRWWGLVCARTGAMVASGIVDALTWVEEPLTRDAFLTVIARQYIIGGDPAERLPKLFADSVAAAEEITEALGTQVRRAVEHLVQAFAEAAADSRRRGLPDPLPADPGEVYSASVTAMMRVVFLLFAEERGLLPQGELFSEGYGISGELDALEARLLAESEESLDSTYLSWHRLLATSQALYRGASFEDMRMPAYGGSLFDPTRYPFLVTAGPNGTLALTISDRVMLHVLRSVQVANLRGGDARRISFRDIDVEQIGYIYEGLLGYTCVRVTGSPHLGLIGTTGAEPEIPLAELERLAAGNGTPATLTAAIIAWAKENQPSAHPSSASKLTKLLDTDPTEDADRLLRAVTAGDDTLRLRLRRWAPVLRPDLRGRPTVFLDGGLLVAETPSRRNAGAHYTPRSLAEEVVLHALEPLCYQPGPYQTPDRDTWKLLHSEDILRLKVADIAVGSGAFLVAAARYLAARLVEAWTAEDPANAHRPHLQQHALREVVAKCLYGADINAMAVEMCKLSLWLVSLDRNLPFSFVDDKILHGNSLLGITDARQLRALHIDPDSPQQMRQVERLDIDDVLHRAADLRRDLATEVVEFDPQRSATAKRRQLTRVHDLTAQLRLVADGIIAAGLPLGGKPGKALSEAYENLAEAVTAALRPDDPDPSFLQSIVDRGLTPVVQTDYARWQPLHWAVELPDVFGDHGGFDAIIGNPPFLGGIKLSGSMGSNVREWLVNRIAHGVAGKADQVAYFVLRIHSLLRPNGILGVLATNSVAQGETREVGLDQLDTAGFAVTRAVQSASWPAASANLEYAAVWGTNAPVADSAVRVADGVPVPRISTLLEAAGRIDGQPVRLSENANIAFQGCIVLGMGFVLDPTEAEAWIADDERNRDVLFPYLNGEDLNSRPDCSPARWVVDFNERDQVSAARFRQPWHHVLIWVRPERAKNDAAKYPRMVAEWWKFWNSRPAMRRAVADLGQILVIARVSKSVMPVRVPNELVPSEQVVVFATDSFADQAVLSSGLHQAWAIAYCSTLETRVRYTPSDVFETFPRPRQNKGLEEVGVRLDADRREIMLRRQLGLTKLYNLVNDPEVHGDPDVELMRRIHVALDEAVMAAYGWGDVSLEHGFHTYRQMMRWTVSPTARVEILDRLLEENHRRAAAQRPAQSGKRGRKASAAIEGQGTLL